MKELKKIFSVGIANVAGNGIAAIFWLYIATIMSAEQYGLLHYFFGLAGIMQVVSFIGGPTTVTVFTAKGLKLHTTLFFISFIAVIIAAIVVFISSNNFEVGLLVIGYLIIDISTSFLLGKRSYVTYTKFILLQKTVMVILCLFLYNLLEINGIILGLVISSFIFVPLLVKEFIRTKIDLFLLKSNIRYVINNYILSLVGGFRSNIDKLIIAPLVGYAVLGQYTLSFQMYAVIMTFSLIAFKYTLPEDAANNSTLHVKKITLALSVIVAILSSLLLPIIIPITFPKFIDSIDSIRIMSFAVIPATINLMVNSRLLADARSTIALIGMFISLISLVCGIIILGSVFNLVGIAMAFVISPTLQAIFYQCVLRIKLRSI
ncbi:lipopolysaccharide biosynthesis protein [Candidatus Nitrosotenuis cloacae]|uniref:lipopolysaccharide biosynthesis protein n=1 Tax=Candidatus Nitrosotenuis cloacae TaxID=1603555 RepID=UPI0022830801|nr:hypothetical protein [Candidatus Nitrosotenuis cloacae]